MSDIATVVIAAISAIPPSLLALAAYTESRKGRYDSQLMHLDTAKQVDEAKSELATAINGGIPPQDTPGH